jgi:hypothetical protein
MVGGTFFVLRILYIEQVVAVTVGNPESGGVVRIEGRGGGILQGGSDCPSVPFVFEWQRLSTIVQQNTDRQKK